MIIRIPTRCLKIRFRQVFSPFLNTQLSLGFSMIRCGTLCYIPCRIIGSRFGVTQYNCTAVNCIVRKKIIVQKKYGPNAFTRTQPKCLQTFCKVSLMLSLTLFRLYSVAKTFLFPSICNGSFQEVLGHMGLTCLYAPSPKCLQTS